MSLLLHGMKAAIDRMGSLDLYIEIAHSFAVTLPDTEAAIAKALAQKSWAESQRLAHSLKSNCASMGAVELCEDVYRLEKACAVEDGKTATVLFASIQADLSTLRDELLTL